MKYLMLVVAIVLTPALVEAHGLTFLEFAPDAAGRWSPAEGILTQPFRPYNDHLSGVDIWVDNAGSPGLAFFEIQNSQGQTLALKTASVPTITPTWSGQRFHVDFGSSMALQSQATYNLIISSDSPDINLYAAPSIQLLEHTALYHPFVAAPARMLRGNAEQDITLKFALYEESDPSPPLISSLELTLPGPEDSQVRIEFGANEPVDWKVELAATTGDELTTDFRGTYDFCPCVVELAVEANTQYTYQLTVKDERGNETNSNGSFITPLSARGTVESALNITNPRIALLTSRSVTITWTTDRASNSQLIIRETSPSATLAGDVQDATLELEHTLSSGAGILPQRSYVATIISQGSQAATILPFATPPEPTAPQPSTTTTNATTSTILTITAPPPPTLTQVVETNAAAGSGSVHIQWSPPPGGEPSQGYRLDIFSNINNLERQLILEPGTHEVTAHNLPSGEHRVVVYGQEGDVFAKVASPSSFAIGELKSRMGPRAVRVGLWALAALAGIVLIVWKSKPVPVAI